jgi:uncharacterized RDD family membrane protein YckC
MSSVDNDGRFAPPRAAVDDVPEAIDGLVLATRGSRLGAAIIDVIVAIALAGVATLLSVWRPWSNPNPDMWRFEFINATWGFAVFLLAHGYLLAKHGQTIGKRIVGIRIVRPDGSAASFARLAGVRYGLLSLLNVVPLIGMVFGLVDSLCIFRASRRCLHDDIADTLVIKA